MPKVDKKQRALISPLQFERPDNGWRPTELPQLHAGEPIALDFEYEPHDDPTRCKPFAYSIYCPQRKQGWYAPWAHKGGGNLSEEVAKRWYLDNVRERDVYGLNMKAEVHSTYNWGIDADQLNNRWHDVAFPPTLLDEHRLKGFSLEALAEEYLPEDERKVHPVNLEPDKFYLAHAGELADRGVSDSYLAWRIFEVTRPLIEHEDLQRVNTIEDNCILPTTWMERTGMLIDRSKTEQWVVEIDAKIKDSFDRIYAATGVKMHNDGPGLLEKVFAARGVAKPTVFDEYTKSDEESWGIEGLKQIEDPIIKDVVQVRRLRSLKSKYFVKWLNALDSNNILRYHLHQLRSTTDEGSDDPFGTCTGRYSSGGGAYKINAQQFMKCEKQIEDLGGDFIVRELVIAELNRLCFASDASQIEFRLFSHYAAALGYPGTAQAYAKNPHEDFHMLVTILMNPGLTDKKKLKALRKHMKHNNFGVLYGMGRPKLARRLGLPCTCLVDWNERDDDNRKVRWFADNHYHDLNCKARQANDIMDEYDHEFPEARKLLKLASERAEERRFVTTIAGRRGRFPDGQKYHKALNKIIQGSAADYFKIKEAELWRERKTLEINLRAPVHDEFMGDISPDPAKHKLLQECLDSQSLALKVPLLWDSGFGNNWREANGQ